MDASKIAQAQAPVESKLHFLDYWRIIRVRKTVILAVFLLVVITTTLVTFILPIWFSSMVRIAVEKDMPDIAGLGERQSLVGYDPYFLQTEFEKIQSKSVLYKVIHNLKLSETWGERYGGGNRLRDEEAFLLLKRQIDVRQSRNTSLIEIRVYSENKEEAARIANEIAKVYKDHRLALRNEVTLFGINRLREQWEKLDMAVTNAQAHVDDLRKQFDVSEVYLFEMGQVAALDQDTLRRQEIQRTEALADYVQLNTILSQLSGLKRDELRKAVLTSTADQLLPGLLERYADAEQKMATIRSGLGEGHPDIKQMKSLLETIDNHINARLDGIMVGLQTRVNSLKARADTLANEVKNAREKDIRTTEKARPYFMAKRDLETQQRVRDALSLRISQEMVDLNLPKAQIVQVVDAAEPGLRPVRPNKTLNIALGVIVGLVVGIGLAFFIEYLDTSVKTIDDVERALGAPVLGVIPQNVGSLLDEGPESPHAEAYRVLRTNLLFSRKEADKLRTITIVSAGAGEGKSTTLFNLATVFAQNGNRVLMVDSDLRRPSLHKILRIANSGGLTNYLLKQSSLEEVIQTTPLPTLDFLPSGKLPSSSMGILSSVQMKELVAEVKRRYDFVFFDSPPIMGVSDASILASLVDMSLQVIQYRRYPQPMTIRAKQMIEKVGGNLVGIVLNNINVSQDENYYYYSGYYYDYYYRQPDQIVDTAAAGGAVKKPDGEPVRAEIKQKY